MITYNHASIFFLIALIIPFTTSNPLSQRFLGIHVSGQLCCSRAGNCLSQNDLSCSAGNSPTLGLSNVVVSLVCNNVRTHVGVAQNVTDVNGRFEISERNLTAVNLAQEDLPCAIWVRIPLIDLNCAILSGTTRSTALVGIIKFYGVKREPFGYVKNDSISRRHNGGGRRRGMVYVGGY